ncbi:unnamed protein product [Gongylonema pulchrum]|uniref:Ovule protein n=1 Tax=Gongylonema pulchrum TaxID=637853 RepID=A0A183DEP9_9BILA|nr:unnamed protein product [Gongylonema pulchrum]
MASLASSVAAMSVSTEGISAVSSESEVQRSVSFELELHRNIVEMFCFFALIYLEIENFHFGYLETVLKTVSRKN